jgi:hypothetical protein
MLQNQRRPHPPSQHQRPTVPKSAASLGSAASPGGMAVTSPGGATVNSRGRKPPDFALLSNLSPGRATERFQAWTRFRLQRPTHAPRPIGRQTRQMQTQHSPAGRHAASPDSRCAFIARSWRSVCDKIQGAALAGPRRVRTHFRHDIAVARGPAPRAHHARRTSPHRAHSPVYRSALLEHAHHGKYT